MIHPLQNFRRNVDTDDDTEDANGVGAARNNQLPHIRNMRGEGEKNIEKKNLRTEGQKLKKPEIQRNVPDIYLPVERQAFDAEKTEIQQKEFLQKKQTAESFKIPLDPLRPIGISKEPKLQEQNAIKEENEEFKEIESSEHDDDNKYDF